jgi:4-hydroxyproline epimerase
VSTQITVIDSHTAGEPTRVVISGGPDLGTGPLAERARRFAEDFDAYRNAIVNEPRGSEVMVGALLLEPHDPHCDFGVLFFNNVGNLGMCGHGTIGLVATLAHLGKITPGLVKIDTPVGPVEATLHANGTVSVMNVASYRKQKSLVVAVPKIGLVTGDIAWGGNEFFLVADHGLRLTLGNLDVLTDYSWRVRLALNLAGYSEVDHVELFAPSPNAGVHSRSFVLCPGKAYDRSPCGTGTSAKLACLAADGDWPEEKDWVQESIIGSRFTARYRWVDRAKGEIKPIITGRAHIIAKSEQLFDQADPFAWGIRAC